MLIMLPQRRTLHLDEWQTSRPALPADTDARSEGHKDRQDNQSRPAHPGERTQGWEADKTNRFTENPKRSNKDKKTST